MDARHAITHAPGERIVTLSPREALAEEFRRRGPGRIVAFTGGRSAETNGGIELLEDAAKRGGCELVRF